MLPVRSSLAQPIRPYYVAALTGAEPISNFGGGPYSPKQGMHGCGCGPVGGCGCSGMGRMGATSLDQLLANATSWLTGLAQSALPPSAAVPPQYGSTGAVGTQLLDYAPYIIGGLILYKLLK